MNTLYKTMHMKSNLKIVISCRCFSDFLVHIHAFQATNPTHIDDSDCTVESS